MKALRVGPRFGLDNVGLADLERPKPGPDQVLLRVRAASLNHRDLLVLAGKYNPRYPLPLTLGSDAVADVVELGPGAEATPLRVGDRVCPLFAQGWLDGPPQRATTRMTLGGPLPGVLSEFMLARADSLIDAPATLSDVEAASLPCAGVTAFSALCGRGRLEPGETLLTQGGGGVSLFCIQIARSLGARVLCTTRTPEKTERLLKLGVDQVLDANAPDWGEAARRQAGGEGVDHVVDLGGPATLAQSLAAVRPGGTVSLVGYREGSWPSLLPAVMRDVSLQGVFVGSKKTFSDLLELVQKTGLLPVIDSVYSLEDTTEALRRLGDTDHFGKVCVTVGDGP